MEIREDGTKWARTTSLEYEDFEFYHVTLLARVMIWENWRVTCESLEVLKEPSWLFIRRCRYTWIGRWTWFRDLINVVSLNPLRLRFITASCQRFWSSAYRGFTMMAKMMRDFFFFIWIIKWLSWSGFAFVLHLKPKCGSSIDGEWLYYASLPNGFGHRAEQRWHQ